MASVQLGNDMTTMAYGWNDQQGALAAFAQVVTEGNNEPMLLESLELKEITDHVDQIICNVIHPEVAGAGVLVGIMYELKGLYFPCVCINEMYDCPEEVLVPTVA